MDRTRLAHLLTRHEGWRNHVYPDTTGHATIGVGRNLDARGLTDGEVAFLLDNDITSTWRDCATLDGFTALDDVRQHVVMDMVFAMGIAGYRTFHRFHAALLARDWETAATELLTSAWAHVVHTRATDLAQMLRTGQDIVDG